MPTLLNWKGHKFLFYSREPGEPPHVHVLKNDKQLKVWLGNIAVARNVRFAAHEVTAILKVVKVHKNEFTRAWNDHFGN